jgi:hypothetical protein
MIVADRSTGSAARKGPWSVDLGRGRAPCGLIRMPARRALPGSGREGVVPAVRLNDGGRTSVGGEPRRARSIPRLHYQAWDRSGVASCYVSNEMLEAALGRTGSARRHSRHSTLPATPSFLWWRHSCSNGIPVARFELPASPQRENPSRPQLKSSGRSGIRWGLEHRS